MYLHSGVRESNRTTSVESSPGSDVNLSPDRCPAIFEPGSSHQFDKQSVAGQAGANAVRLKKLIVNGRLNPADKMVPPAFSKFASRLQVRKHLPAELWLFAGRIVIQRFKPGGLLIDRKPS